MARNKAKRETQRAIKEFEKSLAKEVKANPKAFYRYAQSKLKTRPGIPDLVDSDGATTKNNHQKADVLNKFFHKCFHE